MNVILPDQKLQSALTLRNPSGGKGLNSLTFRCPSTVEGQPSLLSTTAKKHERAQCGSMSMMESHCSSLTGTSMRSASQTSDSRHAGCSDNAFKLTGRSNFATCMSSLAGGARNSHPELA